MILWFVKFGLLFVIAGELNQKSDKTAKLIPTLTD